MDDILSTVAFTGHRTYMGEYDKILTKTIRQLYEQGYHTFLSGMAVGFDMHAAEAVLALRSELSDIRLGCLVPFCGHDERFSKKEKRRFDRIIAEADYIDILSEHYAADVYRRRNNALVSRSSLVVAYCDGHSSGTLYTLRRAKRLGRMIINLCEPTLY